MTTAVALSMHDLDLTGPVGSLGAYIQAVGGIEVLTKEDEQALARRYRENEDLEAARKIWEPILGKSKPDDPYVDEPEKIREPP